MRVELTAAYRQDGEWWLGYVEELPGANVQERTLADARESLKEAVCLVVEGYGQIANRN